MLTSPLLAPPPPLPPQPCCHAEEMSMKNGQNTSLAESRHLVHRTQEAEH